MIEWTPAGTGGNGNENEDGEERDEGPEEKKTLTTDWMPDFKGFADNPLLQDQFLDDFEKNLEEAQEAAGIFGGDVKEAVEEMSEAIKDLRDTKEDMELQVNDAPDDQKDAKRAEAQTEIRKEIGSIVDILKEHFPDIEIDNLES